MSIAEKLTTVAENIPKVYASGEASANTTFFNFLSGEAQEIVLPEGLTSIRDYAFGGYYGLRKLTIPKSVQYIGGCIISDAWELEEITLPFLGSDRENSTGEGYLGYLYGGQNDWLPQTLTKVTLTDTPILYGAAFLNAYHITEVILPDNLVEIGDDAFGCAGIFSINIPETVTTIGRSAFYGCYNLSNISIPTNIKNIGDAAFGGTNISEIVIPNSITKIPIGMCEGCYSLTNVTIPNTVIEIGDYAFNYCSALTEITIPNSVTKIGEMVFDGCENLVIKFDGSYGQWKKVEIDNSYFEQYNITVEFLGDPIAYAISDDSTYAIVEDCYTGAEGEIEIASEYEGLPVTKIADYAFAGCDKIYNVIIPDTVTEIGEGIFKDCSTLGVEFTNEHNFNTYNFTIPDNVTKIGKAIFDGTSLASLTLPFIGEGLNSEENNTLGYLFGDKGFVNCSDIFIIIKQHSSALSSKTFEYLKDPSRHEANGFHIDLSGCDFTVVGANTFDWSELYSVKLPDTVTEIGYEAFYYSLALHSLTLPKNLKTIGGRAFYETAIQSIIIPSGVTSIAEDAFGGSNTPQDIYVPWDESEGKVPENKWGAENATIHYNYSA